MAIHLYAGIYIGTYDVSLKIFEISQKKLRKVEHVRSRLDLAQDSFSRGRIGYELVEKLCDTLNEFKKIMDGYRVDYYEVYASAFLKQTQNELFLLDQIFLRTGLRVRVLSNSEHRFISYEAVAGKDTFEEMIKTSAAVVDVGGASIQITLFLDGKLVTTQHIKAGTVRMQSLLEKSADDLSLYERQIEEYVNKRLEAFRSMYMKRQIDTVVLMSEFGPALVKCIEKKGLNDKLVHSEKFVKFIQKLQKKSLEEITDELNLPNDKEPLIVPAITIYRSLVSNIKPKDVWVPGTNILDGMVYDYAYRKRLLKNTHDFEADVISASMYLSKHYNSYSPHIDALRSLSLNIYDTLKKAHGLGKRERLLLEVATILHDCGKYVSLADDTDCAYQIILSSEIIGLSHRERQIVAFTVLYNTVSLESYDTVKDKMDQDTYLIVAKLSAILRVANALDQSHKQKFQNVRMAVKNREFIVTVDAFYDMSLEQMLFETKTAYFESIYSMKPVLRQKKVYSMKQEGKES